MRQNDNGFCIIAIFLVLNCLFTCQVQAGITRGPYLSFAHDPLNSLMVSWGTDSLMTGVVEFGSDTLYLNTIAETHPDTIHHVELTGLLESTHYYYRVVCGSDTISSDFWTAPTSPESFEIIAYGDSRSYPNNHLGVVNRYMQYPHRLILHAGDLAYEGEYWEFDAYLFGPAAEAMRTSPFISCVGSHDADSTSIPPYFTFDHYRQLMALPENELYFSFDYGPIHVVVLNSEVAWQYGPETPQTQWLMADLMSTNQPYRIAMFHMPPYTSGGGNPNNMLIRQHWCPIFREHHVQMIINGHQHFYQRCEPGDGITYVITGGGGAGLYIPTFDSSYVVSTAQAYHFLWLEVNPDSIHITAIDTANTILDEFSIFPWSPVIPEQVQHLTIKRDSTGIQLNWNAVRRSTSGSPIVVSEYRIYRNTETPYFAPDFQYFVASTSDTSWIDTVTTTNTSHAFYKVTAVIITP